MLDFSVRLFAPGLGDLIMTMPFIQQLVDKKIINPPRVFVFNETQEEMAFCFPYVGAVQIVSFDTDIRKYLKEKEFYVDMVHHPLANIWWGSEEYIMRFGNRSVKSVLDEILGGQGLPEEILPPVAVHNECPDVETNKPVVLLAPGGRRRTKLLPDESWMDIYCRLTHLGYEVGLVGNLYHRGSEQIGRLADRGLKHYAHGDISELINLLRRAEAVISIDSGLYHLASILDKPTLGLFGPMPSWLWGGHGKKTVNMDFGCPVNCRSAPLDWECHGHICMTRNATPHSIIAEFERMMERWGKVRGL